MLNSNLLFKSNYLDFYVGMKSQFPMCVVGNSIIPSEETLISQGIFLVYCKIKWANLLYIHSICEFISILGHRINCDMISMTQKRNIIFTLLVEMKRRMGQVGSIKSLNQIL